MININDEKQTLDTYHSLNKSLVNASIFGKLNNSDVYILNLIYKLLTKCEDSLTESQINNLIILYHDIYYKSNTICKTYPKINIKNKSTISQFQNSSTFTNTSQTIYYINYWKETDFNLSFEDLKILVENSVYPESKFKNTFENFNNGLNLNLNTIGKICIYIPNTELSEIYKIFDILNNDITDMFDSYFDYNNQYKIYMSKNIYASSSIFLKIKKQEQ